MAVEAIEVSKRTAEKAESKSELNLMETLLKTDGLTDKDVVTIILDMIFAGIDTVSLYSIPSW